MLKNVNMLYLSTHYVLILLDLSYIGLSHAASFAAAAFSASRAALASARAFLAWSARRRAASSWPARSPFNFSCSSARAA